MWCTLAGHPVPDFPGELQQLLARAGRVLHLGTDSKQRAAHTDYVTAVAVLHPGHGGRIFYRRWRERRAPSLAHKLYQETQLSLEIAQELHLARLGPIVVHVDANDDLRHLSSKYVSGLAGMVVGYGFQVRVKPDSWCATHVADFVVNERNGRASGVRRNGSINGSGNGSLGGHATNGSAGSGEHNGRVA